MGDPKLSQSLKVLIIILETVSVWEAIPTLKAVLTWEVTRSEELCETLENPNFQKKGKTVISIGNRKFYRYQMTKRTLPLNLSRKI